jgi:hypothetical protein
MMLNKIAKPTLLGQWLDNLFNSDKGPDHGRMLPIKVLAQKQGRF